MNRFSGPKKCVFLSCLLVFGVIYIIASCGGGGGGGDGGTETQGAGSDIVQVSVVMGPIIGADVQVSPLNDRGNIIATGTTKDSQNLLEAGSVSLTIPSEYSDTPLYIVVDGGVDVDADDDGVRDLTHTDNDITLEFVVPTSKDLEGFRVVTHPLLEFATIYVFHNIIISQDPNYDSNLPEGYDPTTDPEAVRIVLGRVAKALLKEDIDGDEIISWSDLVTFHPLIDQEKCRISWGNILDDIERSREQYYARLDLSYAYTFDLDPGALEPIDWDGDGNWKNDRHMADGFFKLGFTSNKNNYTGRDLLDGQGPVGGQVIFPDNSKVSYHYFASCDGVDYYGSEQDVTEAPLVMPAECDYIAAAQHDLAADVGGTFTDPADAPVGEYIVQYRTGDGLEHQENFYVFENKAESLFYAIPQFELSEEGLIEKITLRFEDENGNVLDDPPYIVGSLIFNLWGPINTVNEWSRSEGYYTGIPTDEFDNAYEALISLVSPTAPFYPINNGHKIYIEDLGSISHFITGGDGVLRGTTFQFFPAEYQPQLTNLSFENGQVIVEYSPSSETGREVVSLKYRFDDGAIVGVVGSSLQVDVPAGATYFYITAKDTTGFYKPPERHEVP